MNFQKLVLSQIWQPALGRPKAGLQFGKFGFENSKKQFFPKNKDGLCKICSDHVVWNVIFALTLYWLPSESIFGFQNQNPNFAQTGLRPVGAESRLLAKLQNSILKQEIGFSTPKLREK